MIQVRAPDGSIVQFPDGTPDAEMERAMRETFGGPEATAAAPVAPIDEPSWTDTIMRGVGTAGGVLDQGARGIATGVTNILGLPNTIGAGINDLLRGAAEKMGAPEAVQDIAGNINIMEHIWPSAERMLGAGDTVNNTIADTIGVTRPNPAPENLPERFSNRIGEEVGAMAVPGSAILGRAEKLRRTLGDAAPAAVRESGRISRMFLEPAVVNPGRFIGNETAAAVAAGSGSAAANEVFPGSTVADIGGAIGGVSLLGAGSHVLRSGNEMLRAIFGSGTYVDDVVRDAVTDRLVETARIPTAPGQPADTTGLVDTIINGPRISEAIPGVQESLADRTRNPGVASLEYSRQSGPNAGQFNARRQTNARAIDEAITGLEPKGNPADLRSELALERDRLLMDAGVETLNAQEEARRAVSPLQPTTTPSARGNTVRSALEEARDAARARTEEAYGAANVARNPIDPSELQETLEQTLGNFTQTERSLVPEGLIDRIRRLGATVEDGPTDTGILDASGQPIMRAPEPPEPIALKEATDLRSELQRLTRAAAADPRAERGGRNAARVLGVLTDEVDSFINRNLTPEEQTALEAARGAKFDEAERFTRQGDPVATALARNEGGMPRMRDERVARSFTNPQAMDRLFAQADTPEVRSAIREEILAGADLSRAERVKEFVEANAEQLGRFPGLRDELEQAATARGREAEVTKRRSALESDLGTDERPGKGTVGKFLSFSDANSDKAIREVLSAKDPAKAADDLLTFVGDDPAAVQGARKALWDNMAKASRRAGETTQDVSGAQQWMPAALKRWIDDPRNAAVAQRFYKDNPEHIENISKIADALQGLDIRNTAKVPNTSGTAQSTLPSTETLGSMALAYKRGQIGPAFIATRLGAVFARRSVRNARSNAIERMMDDVLLNPDSAALLLRENNPANRAALKRKAKLWFGNEASTIMNALTADDEEEDDVKRAINGR